ncbi:MAG: hypothetical protein JOY60_04840 [Burkholderiaceae bacterium]|nr:hypothetical protein [Roseateles sp.]MBV8469170.1 hypothetical protein [Burkholderiaceae bacterium]
MIDSNVNIVTDIMLIPGFLTQTRLCSPQLLLQVAGPRRKHLLRVDYALMFAPSKPCQFL